MLSRRVRKMHRSLYMACASHEHSYGHRSAGQEAARLVAHRVGQSCPGAKLATEAQAQVGLQWHHACEVRIFCLHPSGRSQGTRVLRFHSSHTHTTYWMCHWRGGSPTLCRLKPLCYALSHCRLPRRSSLRLIFPLPGSTPAPALQSIRARSYPMRMVAVTEP